ncbi:MAG: hypothetical protein ACREAC_08085 [Blastocatellia bacterium]
MPYQDEHLDGGRGILRVWTGVVTASDVIAATADYYANEDWGKLEYVIVDYSGVTRLEVPAGAMRHVTDADGMIATSKPRLLVAVVASTDVVFGLSRMWQILNEQQIGWIAAVFRSRPEAEAWVVDQLRRRQA